MAELTPLTMTVDREADRERDELFAFVWLVDNGYDSIEEWARESDLTYHDEATEWYRLDHARAWSGDPWTLVPDLVAHLIATEAE